jgi:cytochrome c5
MKWVAGGLMALVTMGAASSVMAADGKTVYEASCVACHAAGVANAPKFGATVKVALLASVKAGKGAMPPKAGNAALTDADIGAAIDFMLAAVK